ncbi:AraC family transcriptional regulator [Microbacteriaceae bacterium K1510]|nr:AraC family transcriptional regulator [Microbacteriaceae bacterium K1510]
MNIQTILFSSDDLPGETRLRKDRWIETLSSGYVRLRADAKPDTEFAGSLKIIRQGRAAIGRISGTVQTIARTQAEIAADNTDNAVLLLNSGTAAMEVEQNGKSIDCAAGSAILIEQCEPSLIRVSPHHQCDFVAIQLSREHMRRQVRNVDDRFMSVTPAGSLGLALIHAYVDTLLRFSDAASSAIPHFAVAHIADLIAAAMSPEPERHEAASPVVRGARFETVRQEIDRSFMQPGFSLTSLARRIGVSPRYIQLLLTEAETSFTDEVTRRRLDRAHEMFTSPRFAHLNVMDVAHECGFSTVSHFHRIFRRRFHATPGEIRDTARE